MLKEGNFNENVILSYPRSGNHLVRFFIELLSEKPTFGCKRYEKTDKEIYKNIFPEKIPFNISNFDKKDCFIKYHDLPSEKICINKLIIILRNPKEVLLRHNNMKFIPNSFETYFKIIDFFNNCKGKKLLLYYEDIVTNKTNFINTLYDFLDVNNIEKKNYVLSNIDKLYDLSSKGKDRSWGGINSNSINYYYKKIPVSIKTEFDNYLNKKYKKYKFLNEKYNIIKNKKDILIGSYKLTTSNNLGDHIQIIANIELLKKCNLEPEIFIERNDDIKSLKSYKGDKKILLVTNGWHKHNSDEWPPNDKIIPIFIGFHVRLRFFPSLLTNLNFLKKYEPIGCRDIYTQDLLEKHDIKTYESNCLTLTLDKRDQNKNYDKVFIVTKNKNDENTLRKIIPSKLLKDAVFTSHSSNTKDFDINMKRAQNLLDLYKNSKLIITTLLHCALPCIAMSIPIIVFWPNPLSDNCLEGTKIWESDYERLSSLNKMIKIYQFSEHKIVNWNPKPLDIDDLKKNLIIKYKKKIFSVLNNNYLIISFCSYDYIDLAEMWITELSKLNITNYIIISTDQKTYEYLKSKNINTELRNYDKNETFWIYRIKILKSFFEKNTNDYLIHSDLDAIWKKNICEDLFKENNNIDLFFSQGTIFPKEYLEKHKFVLCCGFFCIKYNKKTLNFFNNYIKNLEIIKDDQKAINMALINTKWNINEKCKILPNKEYVYYEYDVNGYNPDYDLNLLLISFNKIQREFLDKNGYIYHLLTSKNNKINSLNKIGIF